MATKTYEWEINLAKSDEVVSIGERQKKAYRVAQAYLTPQEQKTYLLPPGHHYVQVEAINISFPT